MQKKRINPAASEVFGAIILLAIVSSVMGLIFFQVSSDKGPHTQTYVKLVGKIEQNNLIVEHQGGESIGLDTKISLSYADRSYNFIVSDLLIDDNHNGFWNLGEKMIFPFTYDLENLSKYDDIEVMSVDKESNSIQFLGSVEFQPIVDLGLTLRVSDPNPKRYDYINATLTLICHGGDINGSANLKIKYVIPDGLRYVSSYPTVGTYDNTTGIWSIDQFICGESVTLDIYLQVVSLGFREFTQFALVLDGSGSISSSDWALMQEGLSKTVGNSSIFPNDGSVELTVIQFGNPYPNKCLVHFSRIVTISNYLDIANDLDTLPQGRGGTPTAAGIYLAADTLRNSLNFDDNKKQVILMVTDGKPTYYSYEGEYEGRGDGSVTHAIDLQTSENASSYLITHLGMTEDQDQFDVFAVGPSPDISWLNNSIVWPQPGHIAPPFIRGQGWVSKVETWQEFSERIQLIFEILFQSIPLQAEIESSFTVDPNSVNNIDIEIIQPKL